MASSTASRPRSRRRSVPTTSSAGTTGRTSRSFPTRLPPSSRAFRRQSGRARGCSGREGRPFCALCSSRAKQRSFRSQQALGFLSSAPGAATGKAADTAESAKAAGRGRRPSRKPGLVIRYAWHRRFYDSGSRLALHSSSEILGVDRLILGDQYCLRERFLVIGEGGAAGQSVEPRKKERAETLKTTRKSVDEI